MKTASLIISIISILIAFSTLYITQLRPPKLVSQSGPLIQVFYARHGGDDSFSIYMPVTIINKSVRTGVILDAAITLSRKDTPEQIYFMQWREFQKVDIKEKKWVHDEMSHAIAIPEKSSVNRIIWFRWNAESKPSLLIREGAYTIKLYLWDKKGNPTYCETHGFFVDKLAFTNLEKFRTDKDPTTIAIRLDLNMEENRLLTEHESRELLDLKKVSRKK